MNITFGADGPNWISIASVIVSLIAICVTSGFAIYGILDARNLRREQRSRSINRSAQSVMLALELLRGLFRSVNDVHPDGYVKPERLLPDVEAALVSLNQCLAEDVPDDELATIGYAARTVAIRLRHNLSDFIGRQAEFRASDWLADLRWVRESLDFQARGMVSVAERLKLPKYEPRGGLGAHSAGS